MQLLHCSSHTCEGDVYSLLDMRFLSVVVLTAAAFAAVDAQTCQTSSPAFCGCCNWCSMLQVRQQQQLCGGGPAWAGCSDRMRFGALFEPSTQPCPPFLVIVVSFLPNSRPFGTAQNAVTARCIKAARCHAPSTKRT